MAVIELVRRDSKHPQQIKELTSRCVFGIEASHCHQRFVDHRFD